MNFQKLSVTSVIFSLFELGCGQFMGYPYDYSSMFQGYAGYNPMMNMGSMGSMNSLGLTNGFGTFGTGMESLYGGQTAFNAYNPYGNGMFNFANNGLFGQNAFGTGFNNVFTANNGLGMQQNQGLFQNGQQNQNMNFGAQNSNMNQNSNLNNGNTMKAYGKRTQNFAPTRQGCSGFSGGCGGNNFNNNNNMNQEWQKTKKV